MASVNPWSSFKALLPNPARAIVTVTALNGNGTSTVTLRSGDTLIVNGEQINVGNKAWIEDGRIVGPAANLPFSEIFI